MKSSWGLATSPRGSQGSLLSHPSITAREHGTPCVVGVGGCGWAAIRLAVPFLSHACFPAPLHSARVEASQGGVGPMIVTVTTCSSFRYTGAARASRQAIVFVWTRTPARSKYCSAAKCEAEQCVF